MFEQINFILVSIQFSDGRVGHFAGESIISELELAALEITGINFTFQQMDEDAGAKAAIEATFQAFAAGH